MRDTYTLVLGPASAADTTREIVEHIRARGMNAWSESLEDTPPNTAAMAWADAVVLVDPTPDATLAHAPISWQRKPRILVAGAWLEGTSRAGLLDDGFDQVLSSESSPLIIAAHAERLLNRGMMSTDLRKGPLAPER